MRAGAVARAAWFELMILAVVAVLPLLGSQPARLALVAAVWVTALVRVLLRLREGRPGQS